MSVPIYQMKPLGGHHVRGGGGGGVGHVVPVSSSSAAHQPQIMNLSVHGAHQSSSAFSAAAAAAANMNPALLQPQVIK